MESRASNSKRTYAAFIAAAAAVACAIVVALAGWMSPKLNWDALAYSSLVQSWRGAADPHAAAYSDALAFAQSHGLVATLTESTLRDGFQATMARDASAFAEQLPFYAVRPLYILTLLGFTVLGGSASGGGVLLSVLSALACALIVLAYAVRKLGAIGGSLVGALFALAPATFTVARFSTPDAMLMLMVCVAFLLIAERRQLAGALLLLAAALVRSDIALLNVLLALALLAVPGIGAWRVRLPAAAVLMISLPMIKWIEAHVGNYGYMALWHYTFEGFVPHPAALANLPILPSAFLTAIATGVKENLANGGLWTVLLLLGAVAWLLWRGGMLWRDQRTALFLSVLFYLPVRLILFPSHDLRLMAPLIASLTIIFVAAAYIVPKAEGRLDPAQP